MFKLPQKTGRVSHSADDHTMQRSNPEVIVIIIKVYEHGTHNGSELESASAGHWTMALSPEQQKLDHLFVTHFY
jgi:hypothetical protein